MRARSLPLLQALIAIVLVGAARLSFRRKIRFGNNHAADWIELAS